MENQEYIENLEKEFHGICPDCDGRGEIIDPDSSRFEPCWNLDCVNGILKSHCKDKNE